MKVLLLQLDGKMPNVCLMRIAEHHRERGDSVELRRVPTTRAAQRLDHRLVERGLWDTPDQVYASLIFERTRSVAERLLQVYPTALVGGTGWDLERTLESVGIATKRQDYSPYPGFRQSIGFTQRGCRLKCPFCHVPRAEGAVREENTIADLWRGEPWPRELILLDNDFFGQPHWRERVRELRNGRFKVSFSQGINARVLTPEVAEALASLDYRDDRMRRRRLHTAWDNRKDEHRLFAGLKLLTAVGIRPDDIVVYMLLGYWPGETEEDWLYRQGKLREFGCRPYPMPYVRNHLTVGFQRWVVGAYDKRVPWEKWKRARCEPRNLGPRQAPGQATRVPLPLFDSLEETKP